MRFITIFPRPRKRRNPAGIRRKAAGDIIWGNTGEPVRNDWHRSGEDWYWFDGAGFMVYNDWKRGSDGTWYYLKENGAMARNEWIIWKKELYRVLEGRGDVHWLHVSGNREKTEP